VTLVSESSWLQRQHQQCSTTQGNRNFYDEVRCSQGTPSDTRSSSLTDLVRMARKRLISQRVLYLLEVRPSILRCVNDEELGKRTNARWIADCFQLFLVKVHERAKL
jgi:hypothetical protein